MKKFKKAFSLALAFTGVALATGCSEDFVAPVDQDVMDEYTKAYIKELGVPDPNHDWSMATRSGLKLKSQNEVRVRVFAEVDGMRYTFADLGWFKGEVPVNVAIPKSVSKLIVEVNGTDYIVDANGIFDIDNPPAGSRSYTIGEQNSSSQYLLSFSEDANDKQEVSFTTDANPWLSDIIINPLNSEYLSKDSKGQPLFPSIDRFRGPKYDFDKHGYYLGDMDVAPLYIRNTDYGENKTDNTPEWIVGVVPYSDHTQYDHTSSLMMPYEDANYGIKANGLGNAMPSVSAGNTWSVTTYRINASEYKYRSGITYWTARNSDMTLNEDAPAGYNVISCYVAHTMEVFNFNSWHDNCWDDEFGTDCESYCSCLFFDNVPVVLTDGSTRYAAIYGLYGAPKSFAVERYPRPDVYIIEFYPENSEFIEIHRSGTPPPFTWRIMAEDLGGTGDWDFNDIVFDFTEQQTSVDGKLFTTDWLMPKKIDDNFPYYYEVSITPRAAGGTLPVYIAWEGVMLEPFDYSSLYGKKISEVEELGISQERYEGVFVLGQEIHDWFGVSQTTMVNTKAGEPLKSAQTITFITKDLGDSWNNTLSLYNFHILRDDNATISLNNDTRTRLGWTKIQDKNEDGSAYLDIQLPKYGESYAAPQMMCVTTAIGWPTETTKINVAYPSFADWNEDKSNWNTWYGSNTDASLIINVAEDAE